MKKLFMIMLMLISATSLIAQEQQLSPRASANGENIDITYGQPSKRGRVIFGDLVPYGELWRAGANEATEVTFRKNVVFAGKTIDAGTYALFVIPKQKEWVIILNGVKGQWGAYDYEKNKGKNIAEVSVPVYTAKTAQEKLTYTIKNDGIIIEWDNTGVTIPVK